MEIDNNTVLFLPFENTLTENLGTQTYNFTVSSSSPQIVSCPTSPYFNKAMRIVGIQSLNLTNVNILSDFLHVPNSSSNFTIDFWQYLENPNITFPNQPGIRLFIETPLFMKVGTKYKFVMNELYAGRPNDNQNAYQSSIIGYTYTVDGYSASNLYYNIPISGGTTDAYNTIPYNKWHHYAFVKNGNNYYVFFDGLLTTQSLNNDNIGWYNGNDTNITIGTAISNNFSSNVNNIFTTYIKNFRVSDIARWTTSFEMDDLMGPIPPPPSNIFINLSIKDR